MVYIFIPDTPSNTHLKMDTRGTFLQIEGKILTRMVSTMALKDFVTLNIPFILLGIVSRHLPMGLLFMVIFTIIWRFVSKKIRNYYFEIGFSYLIDFIKVDFAITDEQLETEVTEEDLTQLSDYSSNKQDNFFYDTKIRNM